jgi:hypothetical protein
MLCIRQLCQLLSANRKTCQVILLLAASTGLQMGQCQASLRRLVFPETLPEQFSPAAGRKGYSNRFPP